MTIPPNTLQHVCLGRAGDIALCLPALKKWADEHGRPAVLMTSSEFMPMLEGCSYVKGVEWQGDFSQLAACLEFLKNDLPQVPVKCLQFYQNGDRQMLPSFWHEQMYLAGILGGEDLPLVFDRRDAVRERVLLEKTYIKNFDPLDDVVDAHRPLILVSLKGHSSPFKDSESFMAVLRASLGRECLIVDLSEIRAERIYDLIGLYDHAAALISIDTVHLHLSKASKVPVFALARDYPDRWYGTPQLERFHWYCRYGQVMERSGELIEALRDLLLNKKSPRPQMLPLPRGAYNPSIIEHDGKTLISYRHHPDRTWRTQLVLDGLPVKFPYPVATCAHEDMRLFHFRGELWASYVCARGFKDDPRCVVGYGQLIRCKDFWAVKEHFQPEMPGNDWSGLEKNAVCFEFNDAVNMIWRNGHVIVLDGSKVIHEYMTEPATWPYGEIRGGTSPLPYKGKLLRFFHSRIWDRENGKPWRYHIGALVMEPNPPFNTIAVSKKPILSGDESGDPMIWHWKNNVCIIYGAVENGQGWTLSLGINDAHCALLEVKESDLNL
jgi:hypothetical protein